MKLTPSISKTRRCAGILLAECLVYIAVFAILVGGGMVVFYLLLGSLKGADLRDE